MDVCLPILHEIGRLAGTSEPFRAVCQRLSATRDTRELMFVLHQDFELRDPKQLSSIAWILHGQERWYEALYVLALSWSNPCPQTVSANDSVMHDALLLQLLKLQEASTVERVLAITPIPYSVRTKCNCK